MTGETPIYYFVCSKGRVPPRSSAVFIKETDRVCSLIDAIGRATGVMGHVRLWKPTVPLAHAGDRASRLSGAQNSIPAGSFERFCAEVNREDDSAKTIAQLFLELGSSGGKTRTALVAELLESVHSQTQTYGSGVELGDVLTQMQKHFRTTLAVSRKATPSVTSKPVQYHDFQSGLAPILDGRYCSTQNTIGPPAEIYHPAFAHFVAISRDETFEPPQDVLDSTIKLMDASSRIVTSEVDCQATTRDLLAEILDSRAIETGLLSKSSSDHIVLYTRQGSEPLGAAALVVIEEKAELGTSCEGSVQGSFSYLQHWTDHAQKSNLQNLVSASCCPSFIISIAGPWLVVLGAVLTTNVVVQHLTDYMWLGYSRVIDDTNTTRLARVFTALRQSVAQLKSFYEALESASPPPYYANIDRFFPLARSYVEERSSQTINFRYTKPLADGPSCVAFLAELISSGRKVVVKFVEHYGVEAHRLLADAGHAPALFYYGKIWQNQSISSRDGCHPRKMVVMEYIEGETLEGDGASDAVREAVLKAVLHLHANGLVHGGIRHPNLILMDGMGDEGSRVKILDFDWAGQEGKARYPYRLSPGLWTEGVSDNGLILAAHDLEMVKRL